MNSETIPPPGVTASQPNQDLFPNVINQAPGMMHDQLPGTRDPSNQLPEGTGLPGTLYMGHIIVILKGEPKVLGTIQILIGLIHFGFGSVLTKLLGVYMASVVVSGYAYWGGLFFIISGSFMVVAENRKSSFLVKGSLGMNIMSSIVAAIGIILFLVDIVYFPSFISDSYYAWARRTAQGLSAVLLIFSILELFIGLVASSFGCKAVYYEADEATHFVPDAIVSHQGVLIPVDPPPYEA